MMPRKPDRFEREVSKRSFAATALSLGCRVLSPFAVTALLREEHRWVERMVRDIARDYESSVGDTAAEMLRDEILTKLKQRRT